MNKMVFNIKNNRIRCNLSYKNKSKTLFSSRSIELLQELERELTRDDYDISIVNGAVVLNCDDEIIQFNNYWDLKEILADYMPTITDDIDYELEIQMKKKVIRVKKSTLKASIFAAVVALGVMSNGFSLADRMSIINDKGPIPYEYGTEPIELPIMKTDYALKVNQSEDNSISEYNTVNLTEETDEETISNIEEDIGNIFNVDIDCSERSEEYDIVEIQNKYRDYAERIGAKWGVSPNLVLAILTQETHGQETNLMQINFDTKKDEVYTVYNFQTNEYCKYVLTDNPSKYKSDVTTITRQDLTNPFTNMSVAIIYYRSVLSTYANNNPIAAIEVYNKGPRNFDININAATNNTGLSRDQLLNNIENPIYLDYSYACNAGDPKYVPNVLQYLNGDMIISLVDENNNITEVKCVINKTKKEELVR